MNVKDLLQKMKRCTGFVMEIFKRVGSVSKKKKVKEVKNKRGVQEDE